MGWKRNIAILLSIPVVATLSLAAVTLAQTSSNSYRIDEYSFGTGGELNACSNAYCAKQSAGETTVGNTASTNYQAQAGFNTTADPMLEVAVNGSIDFGILYPNLTRTGTANIQVRTYLASGYNMLVTGSSPKYGVVTLSNLVTPTTSQAGQEQFGINLRQNTTPAIGADPVQIPDSSFSFGVPSADYNIPNSFTYNDGAIVATSNKSSGQTNYTLSAIANVKGSTGAGQYTTNLSVVVVSTF